MTNQPSQLKRSIGLPLIVFFGLGNILGAGIYVLVGKIAAEAGLFTPFAFALAALVATFTALSYAELSARMPYAGGEAIYMQRGFNRRWLSTLGGLLIIASVTVSAATISLGFVGYLQVFFDVPKNRHVPDRRLGGTPGRDGRGTANPGGNLRPGHHHCCQWRQSRAITGTTSGNDA
jgi:amino acid transporter